MSRSNQLEVLAALWAIAANLAQQPLAFIFALFSLIELASSFFAAAKGPDGA